MPARRVLVVEDQPEIAEGMAALLARNGHQVKISTDSREALEAAKAFHPDIAFLDLGMPHIDGCELARLFREDDQLRNARLVAVTGYTDPQHRRLTRQVGFDAHIEKPVDRALLQAIIAELR
jgi:CheY-like chemotaxis protein